MGDRANNSEWTQNEVFFQRFFYSHQGAMQYKNNYENDSH